eukprot:3178332-Pleurochrysis_carterae.AAC.2
MGEAHIKQRPLVRGPEHGSRHLEAQSRTRDATASKQNVEGIVATGREGFWRARRRLRVTNQLELSHITHVTEQNLC